MTGPRITRRAALGLFATLPLLAGCGSEADRKALAVKLVKILQAVFKALPGGEIVLILTGLDKDDRENVLELKLPKGVKKITITLETGESKEFAIPGS